MDYLSCETPSHTVCAKTKFDKMSHDGIWLYAINYEYFQPESFYICACSLQQQLRIRHFHYSAYHSCSQNITPQQRRLFFHTKHHKSQTNSELTNTARSLRQSKHHGNLYFLSILLCVFNAFSCFSRSSKHLLARKLLWN